MSTPDIVDFTYQQFCDYVRRFDQVALLSCIAEAALQLPDHPGDDVAAYMDSAPWALAAMAKASVCHGNRHRDAPVRPGDVEAGCRMYFAVKPEEMSDPALNSTFNTLIRIAYEQFPYQENPYWDLARVEPFFSGYSGAKPLEVLGEAGVTALLGAPVRHAVGAALVLYTVAQKRGGFFDASWLEGSDIVDTLSREEITAVADACFAGTFEEFRQVASAAPVLPPLDRYMFNPLAARPFLRLDDGRLLAPVPQLIARRLSPIELYYQGMARFGKAYARDMGVLLEDYVGRQLHTLPGAEVHGEIRYGSKKAGAMSIDWIVVYPEAVVLVEAKATRLVAETRIGAASAQESVRMTLTEAFDQIAKTHAAILGSAPEFAEIPTDRPFIGLVVGLDPWYMSNGNAARALLPQPAIPTMVASLPELETLVAVGQRRPASTVLLEILGDSELSAAILGSALNRFADPADENPLLEAVWERLPFGASGATV